MKTKREPGHISGNQRYRLRRLMEERRYARKVVWLKRLHEWGRIDLAVPTKYPGGSEWKMAVISARFSIGLPCWVRGDADPIPAPKGKVAPRLNCDAPSPSWQEC